MTLPPTLVDNPRLSRWLAFDAEGGRGVVRVRSGKVELGQGILTALLQVVADELDVAPARVRMVAATTTASPDEGTTSGSLSVQQSGEALRQVCAEVRAQFLAAAARRLGSDRLVVSDGMVHLAGDPEGVSYWDLAHDLSLDRDASGAPRPKQRGQHTVVGTSVPRLDLADKLAGVPRFVQDLRLPEQVYGRVVRPPAPAARLRSVRTDATEALPGVVAVVVQGSFVAVVAAEEWTAVRAAELLGRACEWEVGDDLADIEDLTGFLCTSEAETSVLAETQHTDPTGDDPTARPVRTLSATYCRPFLAHASIGTSTAVARWEQGRLDVWTNSQGIFALRADLARALDIDVDVVRVRHVEGAGAYGHNGADDVAYDAAVLARAVPGRPVQVMWSRADELGWAPFGPAMLVRLEADLDATGRLTRWDHLGRGNGHISRPGSAPSPSFIGYAHQHERPVPLAVDPPPARGHGTGRNAVPPYRVDSLRVLTHTLGSMPLRTSALRSLGAHANVFAGECFMDELAVAAGADPLEFRLTHLDDERGRVVLRTAADHGEWSSRVGESLGRGLAFARYKGTGAWCAVVAEVRAERHVEVLRLTVAVDVGAVINPDGVVNQVEGGALQATSWTLKEQVSFDRRRVTSDSWEAYPILRFSEAPAVQVCIVDNPDQPSVGAGETAMGPTAAAIGNAVYAATGVRVRRLPITADAVVEAMDQV
jgi:nicotinate dehydrogenase subunit B